MHVRILAFFKHFFEIISWFGVCSIFLFRMKSVMMIWKSSSISKLSQSKNVLRPAPLPHETDSNTRKAINFIVLISSFPAILVVFEQQRFIYHDQVIMSSKPWPLVNDQLLIKEFIYGSLPGKMNLLCYNYRFFSKARSKVKPSRTWCQKHPIHETKVQLALIENTRF